MCGEDLREKNGPRQITPTPVSVVRTSEDLCHVRFGPQPENNVPSVSKRGSRRHSRNSYVVPHCTPFECRLLTFSITIFLYLLDPVTTIAVSTMIFSTLILVPLLFLIVTVVTVNPAASPINGFVNPVQEEEPTALSPVSARI